MGKTTKKATRGGRITPISKTGWAHTPLSNRMARNVARFLRGQGYAVTIQGCAGMTPDRLSQVVFPFGGQDKAPRLSWRIAVAAGLLPTVEAMLEKEG